MIDKDKIKKYNPVSNYRIKTLIFRQNKLTYDSMKMVDKAHVKKVGHFRQMPCHGLRNISMKNRTDRTVAMSKREKSKITQSSRRLGRT